MAKFRVILADCPWDFGDTLTMSKVKRGASSNYDTMTYEDLKNLPVKDIAEEDSILLLWVPSSLLSEGLDVMKSWGYRQTQTHVWVKTKKNPLKSFQKDILLVLKKIPEKGLRVCLDDVISKFSISNILAFSMGRLFRQTHEILLVGVRGKIYNHLKDKSQRSVHFFPATKHSIKPDLLHKMLEKMFPDLSDSKLELFARRQVPGWTCIGNGLDISKNEDIKDSIEKLKKLKEISSPGTNNSIYICNDQKMYKVWKDIPIK